MLGLATVFGALVGVALGLTGGGGAIFAVPLLVFGLAVAPHQAVVVSLIAVGCTAAIGFIDGLRRGQVNLTVGAIFAAGGIGGAPVGMLLANHISEVALLFAFAILLLVVSARLWATSRNAVAPRQHGATEGWAPRSAKLLGAGFATGILSGLLGVGGGFVIVPALLFTTRMTIRQAIATSLMAISIISASAIASYLLSGQEVAWAIALPFMFGGAAGLAMGTALGSRLSGPRLQRVFAAMMVAVAMLTFYRTLA